MEITNKFEVETKGEIIVIKQIVTKEMTADEAMVELPKIDSEIQGLDKQIIQTEKNIQEKKLEKNLEDLNKAKENILDLKVNLAEKISPYYDSIKQKLSGEVAVAKANRGYSRVSEERQKNIMINEILATVALEHNFDMTHPIMKELKDEFNSH